MKPQLQNSAMDTSNEVTVQVIPEAELPPAKLKPTERTEQASALRKLYERYWKLLQEDREDAFRDLLTDLRYYCEDHGIDFDEALQEAAEYPHEDEPEEQKQAAREFHVMVGGKPFGSLCRAVREAREFAHVCNHPGLREVKEKLIEVIDDLDRLHRTHW